MSDATGFTAAVRAGDLEAVAAALGADPELARFRDESGVSVVCIAVYLGREEIARTLVRGRDDLDIFEASTLGDARRVRELISSDPGLVDAYSPDGFQPLGYACFFGRREVAEVLLGAGAPPNAVQQGGATPLHEAAFRGHADLVRLLLRHGADPAARDSAGKSPIDLACEHNHDEIVVLLAALSVE